jgi:hypothetical protein
MFTFLASRDSKSCDLCGLEDGKCVSSPKSWPNARTENRT